MKLRIDGAVLYLGRLRKDGTRNVERIRPSSLRQLLPLLRRAKVPARMHGDRLRVELQDDRQPTFAFMSESA